jgi:hypothetical protein
MVRKQVLRKRSYEREGFRKILLSAATLFRILPKAMVAKVRLSEWVNKKDCE